MARPPPIIIIGAGGHATVVADALLAAGHEVLGFTDKDAATHGLLHCGCRVLGDDGVLAGHRPGDVLLANGLGGVGRTGDTLRRRVQERLAARGWPFITVRHPGATVSPFAHIEESAQLLAGCVVQAGARVGAGSIVNTRAIVEHDAQLGEFTHVAPGAVVCGQTCVGAGSHIGAGAVVLQSLALPPRTVVGAGAVVIPSSLNPPRPDATLIGNPARPMERTS